MAERLQKLIAASGYTSRRKAEQLILDGKVSVNGEVVKELGVKAEPSDIIIVEGVRLLKENKRYYLFYKPEKVITSMSDEKDRTCVKDFFENVNERVVPVGRLDRQVRRMFEALGYEVIKLKRESIEDLTLEGLKKGEYRPLTIHEVKRLINKAKNGEK